MTTWLLYAVTGLMLFALGVFGLCVQPHALRKILAVNVASSGVLLTIVALALRGGEPDPVPHAMVLTGVVVAVSTTAVALALVRRLAAHGPSADADAGAGHAPEEHPP